MTITISTGEAVALQCSPELKRDLLAALSTDREVVLDASNATQADLAFLQLVVAARCQARRDELQFTFAQPANVCLTDLLKRAGHTAAMDGADIDFRFHGDMPQ